MTRLAMISLSLALSASFAQAVIQPVELPGGFDGSYAPEGQACEGLAVITVEKGEMIGGEFAILVTDLIEDPVDPRSVEATMWNSGGGSEWEDSARITLADDGSALRFDYPDGTSVIWNRCP